MDTSYLSETLQDGLQKEDTVFGDITFHHHALGELVLPSGKVVACDPIVFPKTTPFTTTVPPGRYPVIVSVATFADNNDHRIASAILTFSEHPPVHWEMATRTGQDVHKLKKNQVFCYPVDAGIGCFMDARADQLLQQKRDDGTYFSDLLINVLDQNDQTRTTSWSRANICADAATEASIIAFSSGWGDGCYASYWGYDADNKLACLVTDFGLLELTFRSFKGHLWRFPGRVLVASIG